MSRNLVALNAPKKVTVLVGARPTTIAHGVDIQGWRINGAFSSPIAAILLDGSLAATINSPAGGAIGVEVWGYVLGQWWLVGVLNNGVAIPVVAHLQGFAQEMDVIGIFERLAIAGAPTAGAVTATLAPMDSYT